MTSQDTSFDAVNDVITACNTTLSLDTILLLSKLNIEEYGPLDLYSWPRMRLPELSQHGKQIRLLHLQPALDHRAAIECGFSVADLENDVPMYEALSYVWGKGKERAEISLDSQSRQVTQSLAGILRYLRYTSQTRILWIDQLSIDQENPQERSRQVSFMGVIYQKADSVIAWLGEETRNCEQIVNLLQTLSTPDHGCSFDDLIGRENDDLSAFLDSVWWGRIWTLQEVVLAQKFIYQRGRFFLDGNATHQILEKRKPRSQYRSWQEFQVLREIDCLARVSSRLGDMAYYEIARLCMRRSATDPRDIVYGLRNLLPPDSQNSIVPDYTLPASQIYAQTTFDLIRSTLSLEGLSCVQRANAMWQRIDGDILPSYVPALSVEDSSLPMVKTLDSYDASAGSTAVAAMVDPMMLLLHGLTVAKIVSQIGGSIKNLHSFKQVLLGAWQNGVINAPDNRYMQTDLSVEEAIWLSVCNDLYYDKVSPGRLAKGSADSDDQHSRNWWIAQSKQAFRNDLTPQFQNDFMKACLPRILNRRFLITDKGHFV